MEQILNRLIDILENNFSLIFPMVSSLAGVFVGSVMGFFSQWYLNKINQKNEVTKELSKEYIRNKGKVLCEMLNLFNEYNSKKKTEQPDFDVVHSDIYGEIGIESNTPEMIYIKYFTKIIEKLSKNRFYLDDETIKKLDVIEEYYYKYKSQSEYITKNTSPPEDIMEELEILNKETYNESKKEFEELKKLIVNEYDKYTERLKKFYS